MTTEPTYPGLVLITVTGRQWRWAGHTMVASKRRDYEVRAEIFTRPCSRPGCQNLIEAVQVLPDRARRAYEDRRRRWVNRVLPGHIHPSRREQERFKETPIEVRLEGRRGSLELAHCAEHRIARKRRPADDLFPERPA